MKPSLLKLTPHCTLRSLDIVVVVAWIVCLVPGSLAFAPTRTSTTTTFHPSLRPSPFQPQPLALPLFPVGPLSSPHRPTISTRWQTDTRGWNSHSTTPHLWQRHRRANHGRSPDRNDVSSSLTSLHQSSDSPSSVDDAPRRGPIRKAIAKFRARPGVYLLIPCVAALVGWFTNWLAVQMIFYPIKYWGIPLYRRPEIPLGLLGWQGIIPCKVRPMTNTMVDMITTQLVTVSELFERLDPREAANLLGPAMPEVIQDVVTEVMPRWIRGIPRVLYSPFGGVTQSVLLFFNKKFIRQLVVAMQTNVNSIFSLNNCVVEQMVADRPMLGKLFWACGDAELNFLTNSGLWFGFLLGLIQMVVALFWENPWTLSIGGGLVGCATNWLALKWIFQPVNPTRFGPFVLQGQFLRRQKEVSAECAKFFADNILTGEKLWNSILTDPSTSPAFFALFAEHFSGFVSKLAHGLRIAVDPETLQAATRRVWDKLPQYVPVLYPYMDHQFDIETTLRTRMERMSSRQFERVLHPIFEEDELTLILAGAGLGFAAGLVQQGLETGQLRMPGQGVWKAARTWATQPRTQWDATAGQALRLYRVRRTLQLWARQPETQIYYYQLQLTALSRYFQNKMDVLRYKSGSHKTLPPAPPPPLPTKLFRQRQDEEGEENEENGGGQLWRVLPGAKSSVSKSLGDLRNEAFLWITEPQNQWSYYKALRRRGDRRHDDDNAQR